VYDYTCVQLDGPASLSVENLVQIALRLGEREAKHGQIVTSLNKVNGLNKVNDLTRLQQCSCFVQFESEDQCFSFLSFYLASGGARDWLWHNGHYFDGRIV
jgi:hypothetical protein